MKNYIKYICAFVLLLGMSVNAWCLTLQFDFTSNVKDWPTSSNSGSYTYTLDGTDYTFTLGDNVYCNSGYLMFKYTTTLGLPAISGKVLTGVSICNSSNCSTGTYVAITSNTTGTTVTGGTKKNFSDQSYVYRYTLSGTSANTMYYLYITDKNCQITKLMLTYENSSAYTVTYDAENGTCSKDDDTEDSANAGVTLPSATPNASGWEFAGWATETCDETTTAPRLYLEGETYYPDEAITLHAVYRKMTDGTSTSTVTFTASTLSGLTNISNDPYIKYWWLHTSSGVEFYIDAYGLYSSNFNLDDSEGDGWALLDAHRRIKQVVFTARSDDEVLDDIAAYDDGSVSVSTSGTTQTVTCSGNVTQLMMVAPSGEESYISSIVVTYYDTKFNSNPCGNIVALSDGTKTNVSSIAFSSDNIETCSSTAANRQVIVTVTTNTGYKMVDALGFAKTGTVTATQNSGPTGSGPYTYVYEFNQNDNGTGTFSATAIAKTYTITLDSEGGSDGSANVVLTYASSSHDAITNPTKTGYTFAGWYSGDDGTGELVINTNGELQNSVTVSTVPWTDASGNWKKDGAVTLHAKWNINKYKVTLAAPTTVAISATSPSITEGAYAEVNYNSTVTLAYSSLVEGRQWSGWKVTKDEDGSNVTASVVSTNTLTVPAYDVTVNAEVYGGFAFSCAELTLTPKLVTASTPIFITSTASKTVRSQDSILIVGSGLTPGQALEFPGLDSKFTVKSRANGALSVKADGTIDTVAYIFYNPGATTVDGLDKLTGITVKVDGAKPKQVTLSQDIIGRHLPTTGYVIAGKKDNKWYALPSNMASTSTPDPSEIAVDDINNPTIAYTAPSNIFGLEGPTTSGGGNNIASGYGQYVRLTMSIESSSGSGKPAPLFGTSGSEDASSSPKIGKSGTAIATNNLSEGWWWELTQTNTSITNPQDAKYRIKCANNSNTLSIKNSPFVWGLYASGVEELRLIPASDIPFTEAYFVEWGQHGGVIEVDAEGIDANSVTATLNGTTRGAISFAQTLTNGKSKATIYNYTVNFGDAIDFAAAASNGALLTLKWTKNAVVKAVTSIVVPKIIASTSTLSSHGENDGDWSSAEVHVLPGVTLTANAGDFTSNDVMIKHLEIYPGATVVVTKGSQASGTLKVKTLVLRNGWTRAGEKAYDVARLYITPTTASLAKNAPSEDVWYTDWYIDYDQYYPIAVPWDVTLANITYRYCSVEPTVGHDQNIRLRYYDGEGRASSGQSQIGQNWKLYGADGAESVPTKLEPSKGYVLTAKRPSGKAFSILRMPLTIPSAAWTTGGEQGEVSSVHKNQVDVTGWGKGTAEWYAMGWNFIGNPYMCTFNGNDDGIGGKLELQNGGSIKYATIPDVDFKNYDQVVIAEANLKPASGFFVQANDADAKTITFNASKIVPPSAPAHYTTKTEVVPEQEAYIRLSYEGGKDQMGIIINEDYTEAYEVNADLAKVLGEGNFVKTYMQYGGMDMAYVAINQTLAQEWIPVTVILPATGEYTYSLTPSSNVANLEGVYLIDYANGDQITNLIEENYTFVAEAGTIEGRFAINAKVGEHKVPTDIDIVNEGGDLKSEVPFKFIYNDKAYIYYRGVIYDAMGKRVREINK